MIKNLKVAFFVLIIIILIVFVFYFFSQPEITPTPPLITTDEQRLEALQKISNIPPANPKMTDEQRLKLMSQPATVIKK